MSTTLYRPTTPQAFLDKAEAFLLEREAENCLMLGLAAQLRDGVSEPEPPWPYFAVVEDDGEPVAAAIATIDKLVLTNGPENAIRVLAEQALPLPFGALLGPTDAAKTAVEHWASQGRKTEPGMTQGVYSASEITAPQGVPGEFGPARQEDDPLLADWMRLFNIDAHLTDDSTLGKRLEWARKRREGGRLFVWRNPAPVSMALYSGETPNGVRVNAVFTPRDMRGKGYASACVAHLSARLLAGGRRWCFLFTDLSNPTSNSLYQRLGYRQVCTFQEHRVVG